jgi:predicted transposase YbfD/YdcC
MLAVVVCATLSGYRGYRPMMQWLSAQTVEFSHLLGFTRLPPKRKAFQDLLAKLDAGALFRVLQQFIEQLGLKERQASCEELDVEIWDGKTLRGTRSRHAETEKLLVRLDRALGCVLSSTKISEETNEAKTAFALLKSLLLEGTVIVADAAYCQREICKEITEQKGDYLVIVKDNQPQLHRDIRQAFAQPEGFSPLRC